MTYTDTEIRDHRLKFLANLLSDRYEQYQGQLRGEGNRRCCLGLACSVSGLAKWRYSQNNHGEGFTYLGETAYLPRDVADWLGLPPVDPAGQNPTIEIELGATETTETAAVFNDAGYSFAQIASGFAKEWDITLDEIEGYGKEHRIKVVHSF